ncbi:MAG: hypothetical protein JO012_07010 [Hyphomicrobiales bacterium]|nr:hypothetical protein [Hyphomicrobiales bacterium]
MTDVLNSLVVYWLKDGGGDKFRVPPLEDILNLQPYPAYVNLMAGNLDIGADDNVTIWVPPEIYEPLGRGVLKKLQAKGIKVVLSVLSHKVEWKPNEKPSVGWSTMTKEDNKHLVHKIGLLKEQINIDGIDIDDEWGPKYPPDGAENFYNTVSAIREAFPHPWVISNAVYLGSPWGDLEKYKKHPDLGQKLMTHCATMSYGNNYEFIINEVQKIFHDTGKIPKEKLYAGVAPGPVDSKGNVCAELYPGEKPPYTPNWTSIKVAEEVAKWAKTNCAGVMIWSYSADTVEYTGCPHRKTGWPNKNDHAWQKAITRVLTAK